MDTIVRLIASDTSPWTVPSDWDSSANKIEVWGPGAI